MSDPPTQTKQASYGRNHSKVSESTAIEDKCLSSTQSCHNQKETYLQNDREGTHENHVINDEPRTPKRDVTSMEEDDESVYNLQETVRLCCDVYDTGIGIPGNLRIFVLLLKEAREKCISDWFRILHK